MKRLLLSALAVFAFSSASAYTPSRDYSLTLVGAGEVISAARGLISDDQRLICGTPSMIYVDPADETITKERALAAKQGLEYLGEMEVGGVQFIIFNWNNPRAVAFAGWIDLGDERQAFFTVKCLLSPKRA